ncbi:MAG: HD-GYP domain-containing protein [Chloroflexi bacterium]|nr:HD-GYP domain-containing protein [Chloroflexota bacterium]
MRIVLILAAPLIILGALLVIPELEWEAPEFHFYVVSAASLMAALICGALVLSARSIRETRVLFLALSFMALAVFFSVHGLTTPGHFYDEPYSVLEASPWLSTFTGGGFAVLSVISVRGLTDDHVVRFSGAVFAIAAAALLAFMGVSLAAPGWLSWLATDRNPIRYALTVPIVGMMGFAAWRYYQSYQLARLTSQLAMVVGLVLLAEAQVALALSEPWYWSWWEYHALFLAAFTAVLAGWLWESKRGGNVRVIAEALLMRDALAQLNRGRDASLVKLADEIEAHDIATFGHVGRVAAYAFVIGRELGLSAAALRKLVLAAQLHDIGKISLSPGLLKKPGKLTPEEFDQMKTHTVKGWDVSQRVKALREMGGIIRHHHERFDGMGYPDSLRGEEIPLDARIISVADTFDAVTSNRPYRPAMTVADAEGELRRVAGSQLDPRCVQALLAALDRQEIQVSAEPESASAAATAG